MELEQVNAKANAGLTTGIIGSSLGALASVGGIGALLGISPMQRPPVPPEDRPVTRYELGLVTENQNLRNEITLLQANKHTDEAAFSLQRQMDGQLAVNAAMQGTLNCQQNQINQLFGLTKLVVPNGNVAPGWGNVTVVPGPPYANYQDGSVASATQNATNGG